MTGSAEVGRVPDFFIVGHPKCGTTALYEMLRRHPQIYMPDLKEPRFFAPDLRARFLAGARRGTGVERGHSIPDTFEQYLALFAPARGRTPPTRIEAKDFAIVPAPPTSTTQSTPWPLVRSLTALSQSGVVL